MQNLKRVETSTQVGSEEKKSSQRVRKFEDDNYDSVAVYGEDNNEDDDDWEERSFEDIQELIDESETPCERTTKSRESESSPW